jgi:hypothetical protein
MKAKSKAATLKAKRGRPALAPVNGRERNGRHSRRIADRMESPMDTVIERRMREALGLGEIISKDEAIDPRRGSVLGLMNLDGTINDAQFEAGKWYASMKWRYHRLTGIAFPSAKAQDLFAVHGFDGDVSEGAAKSARDAANLMMKVEGWIMCMGNDRQRIKSALETVCFIDQQEARLWPEHMVKYLVRGLNEIIFQAGLHGK